ncbi:uncharacterized protein LOC126678268 [Mercurialis annua]|uniref:uncharacterized protein LOC126678268 n=1 Tax=Mercurialis annua TaxID=3986 RepID=UPI00215DE962|nr:uncharacterized protein LOC126678268 [Mercurialis annua]
MNPKTFENFLNDGMQVEEIEFEKKRNAPIGGYRSNYQSANKSVSVNFVQRQGPVGRKFSEFPIPLMKVLDRLMKQDLMQPRPPRNPPNTNSPNYNPNAHCEFHQNPGHHTDSYITLKHAIQDLIDDGRITHPSIGQPSTQKNLLPNYHAIPPPKGVNTINSGLTYEEVMNSFVETDPANIENPVVAEAPPIAGPLTALFRQLKSQGLIDHPPLNGKLCEYHMDFGHSSEECFELKEVIRALIVEGKIDPSLQIMKIDEAHGNPSAIKPTRWGLEFNFEDQITTVPVKSAEIQSTKTVRAINVWYNSDEDDDEEDIVLKKGAEANSECVNRLAPKQPEETRADELQESQPGKTTSNQSIWDLLIRSKKHRKAMVLALATMTIEPDVTPAVMLKILGERTNTEMVDDGSVINVCTALILPRLGLTPATLKPSELVIRAYDETKRGVEGTFKALVKTGPIEAWVELVVLDIPVTFSLLLGRPWFHELGGVPSTLHQKIKFPYKGGIATIEGESGK